MATAKEFVSRITKVEGVAGCLLVRRDGMLLGQTLADPEMYSTLMVFSGELAVEIMQKAGFSYCRHLSFNRSNKEHFYIFPIENYLLGVVQQSDCYLPDMLESINLLLGRVSTRSTNAAQDGG